MQNAVGDLMREIHDASFVERVLLVEVHAYVQIRAATSRVNRGGLIHDALLERLLLLVGPLARFWREVKLGKLDAERSLSCSEKEIRRLRLGRIGARNLGHGPPQHLQLETFSALVAHN